MSEELREILNAYSEKTLKQLEQIPESHLNRMISGQLKCAIDAHGPIDKGLVGSAAKRISNYLIGVIRYE